MLILDTNFNTSNTNLCPPVLRRYGHGVGSLNVYVRTGGEDRKIWGLTGDAGNNWYMGQAPIASTDNFRVRIRSGVELDTNLRKVSQSPPPLVV